MGQSPHRPIVFIGHSLGCLIIKKVCTPQSIDIALTCLTEKVLVELKSSPMGSHVWNTPLVVFLGARMSPLLSLMMRIPNTVVRENIKTSP